MKIQWWLAVLVLGVVLALTACSSSNETPSPAEPSETSQVTEPTPADETVAVDEPTAAEVEPDEALPDPADAFGRAQSALDALESYRYTTRFLFVAEEDGEPETGSIELAGVVAGPDEKHLSWRDLEAEESFELIQIGNQAWILEEGSWEEVPTIAAEAMSAVALIYAPSVAWGGLFGELQPEASYVGRETVNGIASDHYAATYTQWGAYWEGELIDAAGDIWIAEAGYPVKYHFSATGVDEDGDRGSVTWSMELSDVNEPLTIEPPG
jgi:hypothetical protein